MDIISELQYFYDLQADKFNETRKKHWVEFDILLKQLEDYDGDKIKILEIGCGAGRFFGFLKQNLKKDFEYKGIDLSPNLIKLAQTQFPDGNFESKEMIDFLDKENQQEYDFVIAIASFQHLPNSQNRVLTAKNIYRILKYGGNFLMINRSFSKRFLKKYRNEVIKAVLKSVFSLGAKTWNDIYIPWKDKDLVFYRFYHIFTAGELKNIAKTSSFIIKEISFIDSKGSISSKWDNSRNTLCILEKGIQKNS